MEIKLLSENIRDIFDFPKKGIIYKDITPLLQDKNLFRYSIKLLIKKLDNLKIDYICGIESRGFIFGSAIAHKLGIGFVPVRKKGKLPSNTYSQEYELEYGTNILEIHTDAFHPGSNVVIIDDLLATGGTANAAAKLVEKCGSNIVKILFLVELSFLNGKKNLNGYSIDAVISF
jgi:adenine phosphoribosyltransferase